MDPVIPDVPQPVTEVPDVVHVVGAGPHRPTLSLIAEALASAGHRVLPTTTGPPAVRPPFVATPEVLLASWDLADAIERDVPPGEAVLVSDVEGVGAVLALRQHARAQSTRRTVLVAFGDGHLVEHVAVAGTTEGVPDDLEPAVDWEIAALRGAHGVLAPSPAAAALAGALGAVLVPVPAFSDGATPPRAARAGGTPLRVHLPEPVSRRARIPHLLRALARTDRDVAVTVTTEDRADEVWTGTTWDHLTHLRDRLDLTRTATLEPADLIVLGDRFAPPPPAAVAARAAGAMMLVPADSVAAQRWPDAARWGDDDDLDRQLSTDTPRVDHRDLPAVAGRVRRCDRSRARRVSVAVPVFGDVTYLADTVATILAQDQAPHEVLLVDDGSDSPTVDEALAYWRRRHPDTVRVLRQGNRGVSAARNAALDAMTGDAFVLVDQDDELDPRFLSSCAEALRADADVTAVATWTEFTGTYRGIEARPPFDERVGRRQNPIVSTAVLVDMRVRDAGIRFDPDLSWIYCEDWDFWARIVAGGGRFGLVPEALARHRVHPTSGGHHRTQLALTIGRARAIRHLPSAPAVPNLGPEAASGRTAP